MPAYQVQNTSSRDKAIRVFGGTEVVKAGASDTLQNAQELSEVEIEDFAQMGVKITIAGKADSDRAAPKAFDGKAAKSEGRIKGNKSA